MPAPVKAPKAGRVKVTARLPFDVFREAAIRADARRWSMSEYVAYCVGREITAVSRGRRSHGGVSHGSPALDVALADYLDDDDE